MATVTRTNGTINGRRFKKRLRRDTPHVEARAEMLPENRSVDELLRGEDPIPAEMVFAELRALAVLERSGVAPPAILAARNRFDDIVDSFLERQPQPAGAQVLAEPEAAAEPEDETYNPRRDATLRAEVQHELDRAASAYDWALGNVHSLNRRVYESEGESGQALLELARMARRRAASVRRNLVDSVLRCAALLRITGGETEVDEPFGMTTDRWIIVLSPFVTEDGEVVTDRDNLDVLAVRHGDFGILSTLTAN